MNKTFQSILNIEKIPTHFIYKPKTSEIIKDTKKQKVMK